MTIGTVSVPPPLESHWLITKSSSEMAKTTAEEATIAGVRRGSNTRVRAVIGDAPRSAAASSYCLPMEKRRLRTITTTYEIENVTWPSICAGVPKGTNVKMWVKTSRSETPMTISGVTRGKSMRKFEGFDPQPNQRARPMARSTPIGTAMITSAAASFRLWTAACRSVGSCQTESTGSPQYQRLEKPAHSVRDRVALKENCTAMRTGTSDQMT